MTERENSSRSVSQGIFLDRLLSAWQSSQTQSNSNQKTIFTSAALSVVHDNLTDNAQGKENCSIANKSTDHKK